MSPYEKMGVWAARGLFVSQPSQFGFQFGDAGFGAFGLYTTGGGLSAGMGLGGSEGVLGFVPVVSEPTSKTRSGGLPTSLMT